MEETAGITGLEQFPQYLTLDQISILLDQIDENEEFMQVQTAQDLE